ncbi:MAG: iron ABC transporter substrate-binding protein [Chloroflexi bacterium]|nr:MAG: iron ABC transporter substrate-binding protein [Chloroflexota bacterium]
MRFVRYTALSLLLALLLTLAFSASAQEDESSGSGSRASSNESSGSGSRASSGESSDFSFSGEGTLVVYSGRGEELIGPILEQFEEETGIEVEVRYGGTAELAAVILEEGDNSPADVFIAQDAGALGALAKAGVLATLPEDIVMQVPEAFRSPDDVWVGLSGRARVLVYNPELVSEDELPASILDLTAPEWKGRVGWAPTNGSLQANVTAMRVLLGDEATEAWLRGMIENDAQVFPSNTPIVQAVLNGEIEVGLVNHYYLFRFLAEDPDAPGALYFFPGGDPGSLVNVAGAGILNVSDDAELGQQLIRFLLSETGQQYFADETFEYPLVGDDIAIVDGLIPLEDIEAPDIDLTDLDDLQGTLDLLDESGALG